MSYSSRLSISDEMVERAYEAWAHYEVRLSESPHPAMRAALEAALAENAPNEGPEGSCSQCGAYCAHCAGPHWIGWSSHGPPGHHYIEGKHHLSLDTRVNRCTCNDYALAESAPEEGCGKPGCPICDPRPGADALADECDEEGDFQLSLTTLETAQDTGNLLKRAAVALRAQAKVAPSFDAATERDVALRFLERMGWPSYVTDAIRAMPLDALEKRLEKSEPKCDCWNKQFHECGPMNAEPTGKHPFDEMCVTCGRGKSEHRDIELVGENRAIKLMGPDR